MEKEHNNNPDQQPRQATAATPLSPVNRSTSVQHATMVQPGSGKLSKSRYQEFKRHRRDLMARYSETLVSFDEDIKYFRQCANEIDKLRIMLQENMEELEQLGEHEDSLATNSAALAEANRTVENYRLELIRQNARIQKLTARQSAAGNSGSGDIVHEIASLSFRQLFRLGIALTLPLIIAFLVGALIIALTILFSMGIWW